VRRPLTTAASLLLAAGAALAWAATACTRAPELPEVRVHVSPDLHPEALSAAAAWSRLARVTLVARPEEAELAWLSDPVAALALGERAAPGSAPATDGVPLRHADPQGRFAPLGARTRVLILRAGAPLPFEPQTLPALADPRLRGRVALAPLGKGQGPATVAGLALAHGPRAVERFLAGLAVNGPLLAGSDAEVRALVASGAADVGLASSYEAAAAAAGAARLRVVWPDQRGRGAVVLPTALVVLPGAGEAARGLAAWLAGPDGERLLVARVPGLLPLRTGVPVPPGVEPAGNLLAMGLDWDALAAEAGARAGRLAAWPEGFTEGTAPAR